MEDHITIIVDGEIQCIVHNHCTESEFHSLLEQYYGRSNILYMMDDGSSIDEFTKNSLDFKDFLLCLRRVIVAKQPVFEEAQRNGVTIEINGDILVRNVFFDAQGYRDLASKINAECHRHQRAIKRIMNPTILLPLEDFKVSYLSGIRELKPYDLSFSEFSSRLERILLMKAFPTSILIKERFIGSIKSINLRSYRQFAQVINDELNYDLFWLNDLDIGNPAIRKGVKYADLDGAAINPVELEWDSFRTQVAVVAVDEVEDDEDDDEDLDA